MSGRPPIPVLHVVHSLNVGGAEKLVFDLARATDPDRFPTAVACLDEAGTLAPALVAAGVPVHAIDRRPGLRPDVVARLARLIRASGARVIHAHQYTPFFYGVLAARLSGRARCLFTEHGRHHPDVRKPKRVLANQVLWRLAGATVAVSEHTRRALVANDGFPPDRVRLIYNGVDLRRFEGLPSREAIRRDLGLDAETPVIGLCARLSPEKNVPLLLDAFSRVRARHPTARLVIAGDGPARSDIEAHRDALGLGDAVRLLGFRDDVPALCRAFDVFALSSLTEGTSVTLLEAMYAGCPVVATRVGGNPEIVADGETGVLVPSGDAAALAAALLAFLDDPARARRFGAAGRARVAARFTFQGMVDAYQELYRALAP